MNQAEARYRAKGITERTCSVCKEVKSVSDFSPSTILYLSNRCKECSRIDQYERRRERGAPEFRPRDSIGSEEAGFVCSRCKTLKPSHDFRRRERAGKKWYRFWCRECEAEKIRRYHRSIKGQFNCARGIAKQRSIPFTLTFDEYTALRQRLCGYCGFLLPETGLGLDRIECDKGYTLDNVMPCCWECNQAKSNMFTADEMKIIGAAIATVKRQRAEAGQPVYQRDNKSRGWGQPQKCFTA